MLTTSHHPNRLRRVGDMLATAWDARHDYDVAHVDVYSGRAFLWAEAVCSLLRAIGKPYVVTLRGGNLTRFARRRGRRVARLLGGASAVTTPSRFLFEHFDSTGLNVGQGIFRTQAGSTDQPINRPTEFHLIPNPIDVEAYRFRPRTAAQPRLVWLRAFHRIYQPEVAVAALAEISREFPAAQLTMAGPDKGDGSLARTRRAAEKCGLRGRVTFPGAAAKTALPGLLDDGDIFLNTSRIDNTPVSVLEAMAGGLCIVSTTAGGMPYLLRHESDALLTSTGNPGQMAAAVRRVLREPGLSEQLSRNARRKVEPFDWSAVLPAWERLFLRAVEAPPA